MLINTKMKITRYEIHKAQKMPYVQVNKTN